MKPRRASLDRAHRPLVLATIAAAAAISGCGDSPTLPEPDPTVTGNWSGPLDAATTMTLVLSQGTDGAVTGSGNFTVTGGAGYAITVRTGTHVFPDLSLVIGAEGFEDFNLVAEVSETVIDGRLNGSGFANEQVILVRR